ncbi:MAG: hypothetical protein DI582_10790 [Azospirillum brasilense]|nr:MAG: hypothetical protein DI582_10790 [Azospirillum brasilense]
MGYRYQNKLDEENERRRWEHRPGWQRNLVWAVEIICFALLAGLLLYGSFGWLIAKLLRQWM